MKRCRCQSLLQRQQKRRYLGGMQRFSCININFSAACCEFKVNYRFLLAVGKAHAIKIVVTISPTSGTLAVWRWVMSAHQLSMKPISQQVLYQSRWPDAAYIYGYTIIRFFPRRSNQKMTRPFFDFSLNGLAFALDSIWSKNISEPFWGWKQRSIH